MPLGGAGRPSVRCTGHASPPTRHRGSARSARPVRAGDRERRRLRRGRPRACGRQRRRRGPGDAVPAQPAARRQRHRPAGRERRPVERLGGLLAADGRPGLLRPRVARRRHARRSPDRASATSAATTAGSWGRTSAGARPRWPRRARWSSAWMNSPGHRENLLSADYTQVGLGLALGTPADQTWGATYTTDFGAGANAPAPAHPRARRRRDAQEGQPARRAARGPPPPAAARARRSPGDPRPAPARRGSGAAEQLNRAVWARVLSSAAMPLRPRTAALLALAVAAVAPASAAASTPSANPPGVVKLSDERTTTRWAHTADLQPVFSRPSDTAHRVASLRLLTEDKLPEVYLVLVALEERRRQHVAEDPGADAPQRPHRMGARERARRPAHRPHAARGQPPHAARHALRPRQAALQRADRRGQGLDADARRALLDPREVPRRGHDASTGRPRSGPARTPRRCRSGPAAAWSDCTAPTSRTSSRGARRTAASACATATS